LQQNLGNGVAAMATLHELHSLTLEKSFATHLRARADAAVAYLALQQGDLMSALRWADGEAWRLEGELDYRNEQEYFTLTRIRIAQCRHDPSAASLADVLRLLERLLAGAEDHKRTDSVLHILMLRALVMHTQGQAGAAVESLARALQLAFSEGYVRLFVDGGTSMAQLLSYAVNAGLLATDLRDYAAMLLRVLNEEGIRWHVESATPSTAVPPLLAGGEALTAREMEVLHLLAAGRSNQAIAQELVVEVGTVKRHVSNIMDKLQAQSRLEAVVRARALAIIPK
jgi:LuxR family maltose regulon positive regulatory protein